METLRREIHPEVRVVDRERGIVDYVASDESVDSYKEVIRAKGWRFSHFKKNAPFVDSHDYKTIGNLLGKVIDFSVDVRKGQLVNRVQWAVDVPDNQLAQLGWKMTESGYQRAVSVGFWPTKYLSATSANRGEWLVQLKELGLAEENAPRTIYTEQEQIELSAVIIGANPNALLAAHKAGALSDRDVELFQKRGGSPIFQIPFDSKPQSSPSAMKQKLLSTLNQITGGSSESPATANQPVIPLPTAALRRHAPGNDLSLRSLCESFLHENPEARVTLRAAAKWVARVAPGDHWTDEEVSALRRALQPNRRALYTADSSLGQALTVTGELSEFIYSTLLNYSAWRDLGVVPMNSDQQKLVALTGKAQGVWMTPANQGTPITETASLSANNISPAAATLGALIEVSGEVLSDGGVTFEGALLMAMVEGLGHRIEFTAFQGDGTNDQANGGMTGIAAHASVPVHTAADGGTTIDGLRADDFAAVIGKVAPSALAHPCKWYINPVFLPKLLKIRMTGEGSGLLLKPPATTGDDWRIHGFPVRWANGAPGTEAVNAKVAVFGRGDAYTVAMRQEFEIMSSAAPGWYKNTYLFRALTRARCQMRDATSLATLKLAAT